MVDLELAYTHKTDSTRTDSFTNWFTNVKFRLESLILQYIYYEGRCGTGIGLYPVVKDVGNLEGQTF